MSSASFEIGHDHGVLFGKGPLDEDVVGKLPLDAKLDGFWKEARQAVVLIVQVEDEREITFVLKIGDEEPCCRGLPRTAFGAGGENESARHALSSLFAFELGQPFSHLFGSEPFEVVFSARDKGLHGSATWVLARQRRVDTARNGLDWVNGRGF
jgi:hypothetical protein